MNGRVRRRENVWNRSHCDAQAMERLLESKDFRVVGVLDVTTTELADELCGGVMSAGRDRMEKVRSQF